MIELFAFLAHKAFDVLNFGVTAFKNLFRRNINYSPLKIIITMLCSILGRIFNSRPPDYLGDSRPDGGTSTHWARFVSGVQNTITQILTAKFPGRILNCYDLGMQSGVLLYMSTVPGVSNNFVV